MTCCYIVELRPTPYISPSPKAVVPRHLEADPAHLEEWYVGHSVELAAAGIPIQSLRTATGQVASQLPAQAARIFTRWLRELV